MTLPERTRRLLSEALGYDVELAPKRMTKQERIKQKIDALRQKQINRISQGRTRGAGAGGFNRDVENILHQIRLLEIEFAELNETESS